MAIVGIMAHHCALTVLPSSATMGSITDLTIFRLYFKGMFCLLFKFAISHYYNFSVDQFKECTPETPQLNWDILESLTVLNSFDIYIIMWIYLILNFLWTVSSFSLFTS